MAKILSASAAAFVLLLTGCLAGCARYEYDVAEPPELAAHVGTNGWTELRRGELAYRLRTSDNRLVVHVYNRGDGNVKLLGDDSAAVDPRGESHPLRGATIPPGSYAKWIFPPPRPRVAGYGPSLGVGVGVSHAYHQHHHHGAYSRDPFYPDPYSSGFADPVEPRYYAVYDSSYRTYFDWPGETGVRLFFTFDRGGGERLRHEFLVRRKKM